MIKDIIDEKEFKCVRNNIPCAIDYAQEILLKFELSSKDITRALLRFEEVLDAVIKKAKSKEETFWVIVTKNILGKYYLTVKCPGDPIRIEDIIIDMQYDELGPEAEKILNDNLRPILSEGIKLKNRYGINTVGVLVNEQKVNKIAVNFVAMFSAILIGILMRMILPEMIVRFIAFELFGTAITIFFNLLNMIVAPLVFLSILSSVLEFKDINALGRVGLKTIGLFVLFSIFGLAVGVLLFRLFPSGDATILNMLDLDNAPIVANNISNTAWISFKNIIISVFPDNLIGAFVDNQVLAVIFIAILTGICTNKLQPNQYININNAIKTINDLICEITAMITSLMPIIIFSSMAKLAITINVAQINAFLIYMGDIILGLFLLMFVYAIALKLNGINPFNFFKQFSPAIITGFTLASSSAVVPISLKCCTDNLKLPSAVAYFVIPLGSTINMNGSCILLTVTTLFTSRVFGIEIAPGMLIMLLFMILLLAMASPGVPGGMVIMQTTILSMLGIPSEAINLTVGFAALIGMFMVPVNCTGDAVTAMIIDKFEKKK